MERAPGTALGGHRAASPSLPVRNAPDFEFPVGGTSAGAGTGPAGRGVMGVSTTRTLNANSQQAVFESSLKRIEGFADKHSPIKNKKRRVFADIQPTNLFSRPPSVGCVSNTMPVPVPVPVPDGGSYPGIRRTAEQSLNIPRFDWLQNSASLRPKSRTEPVSDASNFRNLNRPLEPKSTGAEPVTHNKVLYPRTEALPGRTSTEPHHLNQNKRNAEQKVPITKDSFAKESHTEPLKLPKLSESSDVRLSSLYNTDHLKDLRALEHQKTDLVERMIALVRSNTDTPREPHSAKLVVPPSLPKVPGSQGGSQGASPLVSGSQNSSQKRTPDSSNSVTNRGGLATRSEPVSASGPKPAFKNEFLLKSEPKPVGKSKQVYAQRPSSVIGTAVNQDLENKRRAFGPSLQSTASITPPNHTAQPWNERHWREFARAMNRALIETDTTALKATDLFTAMYRYLPPGMRHMDVEQIVRRLKAWQSKVPK